MDPFSTTVLNYKPENYFPRINQEYRDFVRKGFLLEEIRDEDKFSNADYYEAGVEDPFNIESPSFRSEGADDIKPVTRGQKLDVLSILSSLVDRLVRCVSLGTDNNYNNHCEFVDVGVEESLKGKSYVLLVCAFVPAKWCELSASSLAQLSIISTELSSFDDFEMVFVPVMRRKPDLTGFYGADAFDHFFTAFPSRLAVPVSSHRACDIMCRKVDFTGELKAILIGPNHEVLPFGPVSISGFDSASYPFTPDRYKQLQKELPELSLARLFGHDPASCLRKFGSSETLSIDQLSTKLVGIYLFKRGDKFRAINEVYQKCRDKDRSNGIEPRFEIVLVCMPPYNSINPFVFQEEACTILQEFGLGMSWWVFPYDNSACCRFSELTEAYRCDDAMIIVDPRTSLPDPHGGEILNYYGMDAYPFTREALVQRYMQKAEQVTLQSLLCREAVDYVVKPDGQRMSVSELEGKYVFLYMDRELKPGFATIVLNEWLHQIKEHHSESDFEFVFVPYKDFEDSPPTGVPQYEGIPWLVYPSDAAHSAILRTHDSFFLGVINGKSVVNGLRPPVLLVFGKDGHIHLLNGVKHVMQYGTRVDPFLPKFKNLRFQVIQNLRRCLDFMCRYD